MASSYQLSGNSQYCNPIHRLPDVIWLPLLSIVYFIATRIGLSYVIQPESLAIMWPASGIALAALLLRSRRNWPASLLVIFATNMLSNLMADNSLILSFGFAMINLLEPFFCAWVLFRFCGSEITFSSVSEVIALSGVSIIANGITAMLGAAMLHLTINASFYSSWLVWWVSDGLGIILITPVILSISTIRNTLRHLRWQQTGEVFLLFSLLAVITSVVFPTVSQSDYSISTSYFVFPLLILIAIRCGHFLNTLALMAFSSTVMLRIFHDVDLIKLSSFEWQNQILNQQAFIAVAVFSMLTLAAVVRERVDATLEARKSEEKYRILTESMKDVVWTLDADTLRFLYVSPSVEKLRGYTPAKIMAKNLDAALSPDQRDDLNKLIRERTDALLAGRITSATYFINEVDQPCKDGSFVNTEVITRFYLNHRSGKVEVHGVTRDITERKKTENELLLYKEKLEELVEERTKELYAAQNSLIAAERLAVLGKFAGSIAHELINPLGVADSSCYILENIEVDKEKTREHLKNIRGEIKRCADIINSIQRLSKMEEPRLETIPMNSLVAKALTSVDIPSTITVHANEVTTDDANVDIEQMRIAIRNLISNAVQAMPDGGELTIKTLAENKHIKIFVGDTGSGISAENREKIFDLLFSTKRSGMGFGLSIVKMIVEKHKGRIQVESEEGKGTTFTIELPVS